MCSVIVLLTAGVPAFAPAPVWTRSKRIYAAGNLERVTHTDPELLRDRDLDLVRVRHEDPTVTLSSDGKESVYDVAQDAKVTINGRKGYSIEDLGYGFSRGQEVRVVLTMRNGDAVAIDVTYALREGEKLWSPGMSPCQIAMRKALAIQRLSKERWRQQMKR